MLACLVKPIYNGRKAKVLVSLRIGLILPLFPTSTDRDGDIRVVRVADVALFRSP